MTALVMLLTGLAIVLFAGRALDEDNEGPTLFDFVLFALCLVSILHARKQREEDEG